MFIEEFEVHFFVGLYSRFSSAFSSFHMYCIGKLGKERNSYYEHFQELKEAYNSMFDPNDPSSKKWHTEAAWNLMENIERILNQESFTDDHVSDITKLLKEFKENHELHFRFDVVENGLRQDVKRYYPKQLIDLTHELMESEEYESAVLASFKYLDSHLQATLNLDPNKYYGEELINYAFSSTSGALRFSNHLNEQAGIRNFFSGANAIFRNPLAHKIIWLEEKTAASIIVLIKLMAELVTKIHENNSNDRENLEYY